MMRAGGLAGGAVVAAWLLAITYHVALFAIMYFLPWLSGMVRDRLDVPLPFTDIVGDVEQTRVTLSPSSPVETPIQPEESQPLQFKPQPRDTIVNIVPHKAEWPMILGIGTAGGEFDKYDFSVTPGSGGPEFFGLGGQARGARNIAYVVDRSGSMLTTIAGVKKELRGSIGALRRSQKFHVIFFNTGAPLENPPRRMVSAINAHKTQAFEFIESITAGGGTDPRLAVRRAFAVEPDLVYLLTDGEFDPALVELLSQLNRDRSVRIFTIAYVSRNGAQLLERIAREHNGEFRFVSEDEIFQ